VVTTSELIKRVSKKTGVSEAKVSATYYSIIRYLSRLAAQTDTTAIRIPFLGVLYVKVKDLHKRSASLHEIRIKKPKYYAKTFTYMHEIILSKLDKIYKHITEHKGKKGFQDNKHFKKSKIDIPFFNGGKTIQEIEQFQNEES
jgi:hypothetical protein